LVIKKEEGRGKKEEGRRKREEGRGKKEEGRRKKEEGRGMKEEGRRKELKIMNSFLVQTSC
jgi:hypothetical protein